MAQSRRAQGAMDEMVAAGDMRDMSDMRGLRLSPSLARLLVALVVGLTGLANMVSVFVPRLDSFLDGWPLDFDLESSVRIVAAIVGFLLIMLSRGLVRGKRKAWELTLGLLALSTFFHAARGGWVLASWGAVLAVILVGMLRPLFRARSDPPSVMRGYAALFTGLALVFVYAVSGFYWLRTQFAPVVHLESAIRMSVHTLAWMRLMQHIPLTPQAHWFLNAVPWLSLSALAFGVVQVLRPVATTLLPAPLEREEVQALVRRWGTGPISYFALTSEKSYYFDSSHRAVLAYRLAGNVAVVAGDPIGPPDALPGLVGEFAAFCQQQDWHVVYWQVAPPLLGLYTAQGLQTMKIGEDAVIDPQTFTLRGNAMQNVRASARHAEKAGLAVRFFRGPVTEPSLVHQMEAISSAWLAQKGGVEMGFSMGRFGEQSEGDTVFALAVDNDQRVHAFVNFVPVYGRNGWALDLMRRDAAASGAMELLLAGAIEYFAEQGAEAVSLGLAPQANSAGEPSSSIEQLCSYFTSRFGGLAKARSLYNFKRKFQPRWESRYLVYPNTMTLPRVGLALAAAHLSRQWLPWTRASARRAAAPQVQSSPSPSAA
jgi:phosphatidylglycerol lysyltransferase